MKRVNLVYGVWLSERGLFLLERKVSRFYDLPWETVWETPGGKIDKGETPDQALLREFKEETGLEATIKLFLGSTRFDDHVAKLNALFYLVDAGDGEIKLSDPEHVGWRFFGWKELEELENIALTSVAALKFLDVWGIRKMPRIKRSCDCELFLPVDPEAGDY